MLSQLKIKDFAIIDDITISFEEKMTVLTGETGSGKSIIIDAINLLLGERASSEMIRYNKEKAIVEGLFFYNNPHIDELLKEYGIENEEKLLIINRQISHNGRNICRLNGQLITVNQLKQLGQYLVDVHVQNDTMRLINSHNYLSLIDSFCGDDFKKDLKTYQNHFHQYLETLKKYNDLIAENRDNQQRLDFLAFQQNEFKEANISIEEYEELMSKRNQYLNFDKIYENLNSAYQLISDENVLENVYQSANNLQKLTTINKNYENMSDALFSIYYQLDDLNTQLSEEVQSLDYNPNELDSIESRLNVYSILKRKYKMDVAKLIDYKNELAKRMENIENFDVLLNDLQKELKQIYQETIQIAKKLREKRQSVAKDIEEKLVKHLKDLKLTSVFHVMFNHINVSDEDYLNHQLFNERGMDTIDFHVSFNIGEPTKPLAKIASGGELSRFMLGLKTILTDKQNLSTIIFDEIDTGVSGITASAIAQKIKSISFNTQVLCISHLPQVASISDHHLYISKVEKDERTVTNVKKLTFEERVLEIAKMIAGDHVNDVVIENAKNLLKVNL